VNVEVEVAVKSADVLGECPLWCEREGVLWWVDSRGPSLKRWDPKPGGVTTIPLPHIVGSIAFREKGGLLAALQPGIFFLDPESRALEPLAQPEAHLPGNRFNDGRCDRAGRFWAGTMSDAKREPTGSLYRLSPDRACKRVRDDVIVPNSLAWSADNRTMYFADTYRQVIRAWDFDLASGEVSNERVFCDTTGHPGRPDGSCVDADGCLWNAEYGGWRVVRYMPSGKIDRVIAMPVANPTCCCFGGADFDTLYITSATQRLTPEDLARQPLAGSVFAVRPGVRGLPESRYGG
jgi:sugar lactone lactonase YvrE